jgi:hypothetical protein
VEEIVLEKLSMILPMIFDAARIVHGKNRKNIDIPLIFEFSITQIIIPIFKGKQYIFWNNKENV